MLFVASDHKITRWLGFLAVTERQRGLHHGGSLQLPQTEEPAADELILAVRAPLAIVIVHLDPEIATNVKIEAVRCDACTHINFNSLSAPFSSSSLNKKSFQLGVRVFIFVSEVRIFLNPPDGSGLEIVQ